jgi:hypothetical protein
MRGYGGDKGIKTDLSGRLSRSFYPENHPKKVHMSFPGFLASLEVFFFISLSPLYLPIPDVSLSDD